MCSRPSADRCHGHRHDVMSTLGQKRTLHSVPLMTALPPKADIGTQSRNVCFVPKADILHIGKALYFTFIPLLGFPSGIPMPLSAHHPQRSACSLRAIQICGAVMKAKIKTARLQSDQGKSPFSAVACILLLLLSGILVKFAAVVPILHIAY